MEVTQALFIDLDLLKNTDLFSRLARPKMRAGVQKEGMRILKEMFDSLKKNAEILAKTPEPTPTPVPSVVASPLPTMLPTPAAPASPSVKSQKVTSRKKSRPPNSLGN